MSVQPDLTNSSIDPASNGLIQPLPRHQMTIDANNRYYAITANTVLEMYYDSSLDSGNGAWVIVGNPIVMSASNYTVYANGLIEQWGNTGSHSAGNVTVNFYVNFNTNSSISINGTANMNADALTNAQVKSFTVSSCLFYVKIAYSTSTEASDVPVLWSASGY